MTSRLSKRLLATLGAWLVTATGCPSDDDGGSTGTEAGTTGDPTTSIDTSTGDLSSTGPSTGEDTLGGDFDPVLLDCPSPGSLPFSTQSTSFETSEAADVVATYPRNKDEASDILGNPDAALAYTAMGEDQAIGVDQGLFVGRKGRTNPDEGLLQQPVAGEWVSLWGYDGMQWTELGRTQTDAMGSYTFADVALSQNRFQPHYAVLEGDQTCAAHYQFVLPPGAQVVVADIDGTLTLSDDELFMQISDGSYDPVLMGAASELMNAWADKGYTPVYLTARPHAFRSETRQWLEDHDFPTGPLISANALVVGETARSYKATWVQRVLDGFAWDIVAAYGNADSDVFAYADAGIPKEITFIVGEFAGLEGTQPIDNEDYAAHIADFVDPYPAADPID